MGAQLAVVLALSAYLLSRPRAPLTALEPGLLVAALILEATALRLPGIGFFTLSPAIYLGAGLVGSPAWAAMMAVACLTVRTLLRGDPRPGWRLREGLVELIPVLAALTVITVIPGLVWQVVVSSQVYMVFAVLLRRSLSPALSDPAGWERAAARLTPVLLVVALSAGLLWQLLQVSPWAALWLVPVLVGLRFLVGEAGFGAQLSDYNELSRRLVTSRVSQDRLSEELAETRQGLQRKVDEYLTLEELSSSLHRAASVQDCLDVLLAMVDRLVSAQSVALFVRESDGFLCPRNFRSPYRDTLSIASTNRLRDPRVEEAVGRSPQGPRLFSDEEQTVALPLGEQGVLYVGRPREPFSDMDRQLLSIVSAQGAAALARLEQKHPPSTGARPEPGTVLQERYRIVRALTKGGMGAVYLAEDAHLDGASCAIKEMLEQHLGTGDEALIQRKFQEEKTLLARLNHPGIPRVRDFFRIGGLCYIVMDYIHGANMDEELRDCIALTGHPFVSEVLAKDMVQVLDILVHLHELDPPVVHRDIKPANLIREFKSGRVMLVDFGLARPVEQTGVTQTAVGTLGYSSLEQIQGRAEVRSDLYSLGVTMAQLLSGHGPIPLQFRPVRQLEPSVDEDLAAIVDRASALDPSARYPSARAMREDLRAWVRLKGR
ncbi:MAG: hypothetical protein AMXMBFR33_70910 [Candidatus Xenobia bacterium]